MTEERARLHAGKRGRGLSKALWEPKCELIFYLQTVSQLHWVPCTSCFLDWNTPKLQGKLNQALIKKNTLFLNVIQTNWITTLQYDHFSDMINFLHVFPLRMEVKGLLEGLLTRAVYGKFSTSKIEVKDLLTRQPTLSFAFFLGLLSGWGTGRNKVYATKYDITILPHKYNFHLSTLLAEGRYI